jgi:hypothetical protein
VNETPPLLQSALNRFAKVAEQAEGAILRFIRAALGKGTAWVLENRESLLDEVRALLLELREMLVPDPMDDPRSPGWEVLRDAYRTGSDRAVEELEGQGLGVENKRFGDKHLDAIEILFTNLKGAVDDAVAYVGRFVDTIFRRVALDELVMGEGAEKSEEETARAIEKYLKDRGIKSFKDKAGREWNFKNYVNMVAATVAREAHTYGTLNRMVENGYDLVHIPRHPHPEDVCSQYEDQVYSISGTSTRYPPLEAKPPFHPNCKHYVRPYIGERIEQAVSTR